MAKGDVLVIVESPAKAKTFNKYLAGQGFDVDSSAGHIRDLPKTEMGFDLESLRPTYEVTPDKKSVVARLRSKVKQARKVLLATDLDREGESIAWHLAQTLGLKKQNKPYSRIYFKEITKKALLQAIQNELSIDMNMVAAQEARRLLDRYVGYTMSPWLKGQMPGRGRLSAGRVQSVTLRIIVERCRAIENHIEEDYYIVKAHCLADDIVFEAVVNPESVTFKVPLGEKSNIPAGHISQRVEAQHVADFLLQAGPLTCINIERKRTKEKAPAPFITATLQQAAANKLGFNPKLTMSLAQKLYESGKITYMRTDTENLGEEAVSEIRNWVSQFEKLKNITNTLLPDKPNTFKSNNDAQEAHEAIRPTSFFDMGKSIQGENNSHTEQLKSLYRLILQRALCSQLKPALYDKTVATLQSVGDPKNGKGYELHAKGRVLVDKGWRSMLDGDDTVTPNDDEDSPKDQRLPDLVEGERYPVKETTAGDKKTRPPAYFTMASIVNELEKRGIGRPATYSATIDKLQNRKYTVNMKKGRRNVLVATELGCDVNDMLAGKFQFTDIEYTRLMEEKLDLIASKESNVREVLGAQIHQIKHEINQNGGMPDIESFKPQVVQEECPKCGEGQVVVRNGKSGPFGGCSNYPKCRYTMELTQ